MNNIDWNAPLEPVKNPAEYKQGFDDFTEVSNGVRLAAGGHRIALSLCHLEEALTDVYKALECAWKAGDFERYDQIGESYLEIRAAVERLRGLAQ